MARSRLHFWPKAGFFWPEEEPAFGQKPALFWPKKEPAFGQKPALSAKSRLLPGQKRAGFWPERAGLHRLWPALLARKAGLRRLAPAPRFLWAPRKVTPALEAPAVSTSPHNRGKAAVARLLNDVVFRAGFGQKSRLLAKRGSYYLRCWKSRLTPAQPASFCLPAAAHSCCFFEGSGEEPAQAGSDLPVAPNGNSGAGESRLSWCFPKEPAYTESESRLKPTSGAA